MNSCCVSMVKGVVMLSNCRFAIFGVAEWSRGSTAADTSPRLHSKGAKIEYFMLMSCSVWYVCLYT